MGLVKPNRCDPGKPNSRARKFGLRPPPKLPDKSGLSFDSLPALPDVPEPDTTLAFNSSLLSFSTAMLTASASEASGSEDGDGIIEPGEDEIAELARATQNPVADLISLPFQYNVFFETGPKGGTQNVLLVQPVLPFHLNEDWNFIARPIIPLINQPPFSDSQNRNHGLGNVQFQGYFSPKEPVGDWIVGFGTALEFPTNSGPDGRFGKDNWSAGPGFVALQMKGPWVFGGLFFHLWDYHGNDPETNVSSFQPIVNYNLNDGWYLSSAPVITYDWSAETNQKMTVPIGGGIGRVFRVGKQPINTSLRAYHNVEAPRHGADWQLQFQVQFLFPKKK